MEEQVVTFSGTTAAGSPSETRRSEAVLGVVKFSAI